MIAVISPAKSLDFDSINDFESSKIPFPNETQTLVKELQTKSIEDLKKLMSVSEAIAKLNVDRYYSFSTKFQKDKNAKHALFAFTGDVYQGIEAKSLTQDDINYSQDHLRILSGLYGLLKPLDMIQAYRLEMGTRLNFDNHKHLYDFWGSKITSLLNKELKKEGSKLLLNLASQEYFKSVKPKELEAKVVSVDFKDFKNGQFKTISFFAKKARGMMVRYFIQNQCTTLQELKQFDSAGYFFSEEESKEDKLVFLRKNIA